MWAENIKRALKLYYKTGMGNGLDLSGSEWSWTTGSCWHGNDFSCPITCREFLRDLNNYSFLKKEFCMKCFKSVNY